ncbi:MAG: beta-galactosidase [Pseudomonadota bacterium]
MTIRPPRLGVCYYPEHWPEAAWAEDAAKMAALGLRQVRIGEFAWAKIEPAPGAFDWAWLDRAVDTLGAAGLEVMLGTPTATPPKWLIDAEPDILALDRNGRPRRFGSRRHYCFSSRSYRKHTERIVEAMASRYGAHEAVAAWQTDNEYGCHDTTRSYSPEAARAFRLWLAERYGDVDALNTAWGAVFWSQTYRSFDEVDLPNLTVTEPNPAHVLDFYRFSSDQVISYNRLQVEILRRHSPGRRIIHNGMGFTFDFDHFALGRDLDAFGWDSYPLGFLDIGPFSADEKRAYMRQGHPDLAAFHHDLYRACGNGRWEIVEQQPGPVNWARHNPEPLPGMVRLWTHEAIAHGADVVSYFRWRQAPFAQEQMHAGLERPDRAPAPAAAEAARCAEEIAAVPPPETAQARVALLVDYEAQWVFETQRQGAAWSYPRLLLDWHGAARRLGVDVDIVSSGSILEGYDLLLVPSLPIAPPALVGAVKKSNIRAVFGPRSFSKTPHFAIPETLPPGPLQDLLPLKVVRSESFPRDHRERGAFDGVPVAGQWWLDHVETDLEPLAATEAGRGLLYEASGVHYFTTAPEPAFLTRLLRRVVAEIGLDVVDLPEGVRLRRRGGLRYAFNYGAKAAVLPDGVAAPDADLLVGERTLPPAGVAIWRDRS